jgi:hypothetical protein
MSMAYRLEEACEWMRDYQRGEERHLVLHLRSGLQYTLVSVESVTLDVISFTAHETHTEPFSVHLDSSQLIAIERRITSRSSRFIPAAA